MAYPQNPYLKYRYYNTATTSSSGAPVSTVVVASKCKWIGGYLVTNQLQASKTNDSFDVVSITQATSLVAGATLVLSSGVAICTSTGTFACAFGGVPTVPPSTSSLPSTPAAVYLNPGDLLVTLGSTSFGGFVTHVVQEL